MKFVSLEQLNLDTSSSPLHANLPSVSRLGAAIVVGLLLLCGCATPTSGSKSTSDLFETPQDWEVISKKQGAQLLQVNLQSEDGKGRILFGKLEIQQQAGDLDAYLNTLHNSVVDRVRGQVNVAPFAEELITWDNGMVGYRTKLRGEVGNRAVIIEGITFSDGESAYFNYGLFRESTYQDQQVAYQTMLASLRPLRGASIKRDTGMNISSEKREAMHQSPSHPISPQDYKSPKTHLGYIEWGTSREEILEREGEPFQKGRNSLGYRCKFLDLDNCVVIYMFTYGKLTHGGYLIENDFHAPAKYVSTYLKLTGRIAREFGRPQQSAAIWSNPEFRDVGKKWGQALDQGDVVFGSVWELGPTKVVHSLKKSEQRGIDHRILLSNDILRRQLQQAAQ